VQEMVPILAELFIGTVNDFQTGPVIAVGRGGTGVEDSPDVCVELAPVSLAQAVEMVGSVSSVVSSVGSLVEEVAGLVVLVSELAAGGRDVVDSIDINPVIFTSAGYTAALDVRVQLKFDGQERQVAGH
jgi:hypothetical protein